MKKLTKEAQKDKEEFEVEYMDRGCTCFINPPCSYCTHPGNPTCLEDESCWEEVEDDNTK